MRRNIIFLLLLCCLCAARGQTGSTCIYWLDDGFDGRRSISLQGDAWTSEIDVESLSEGIHAIHFLTQTADEKQSVVTTRLFVRLSAETTQAASSDGTCFYWLDNDYANGTRQSIGSGVFMLDLTQLTDGIHALHIQAGCDRQTPTVSKLFVKLPKQSEQAIQANGTCYVWIDEDYTKGTRRDVTAGIFTLDIDDLTDGIHVLHVQAGSDRQTPTLSSLFFKLPKGALNTVQNDGTYYYWIDDDYTHGVSMPMNDNVFTLDVNHLPGGIHTLHIHAGSSAASPTVSRLFFKLPSSVTELQPSDGTCYYWLDDDRINGKQQPIGDGMFIVDVSHLPYGIHALHVQAGSDRQMSVVSKLFIKMPEEAYKKELLARCDYWVNNEKSTYILPAPSTKFQVVKLLPVSPQDIRSCAFHFAVEDETPVLYAKNDIRFRFYISERSFADSVLQYVDYNVRQEVDDILPIQPNDQKTIIKPQENEIRWFCFEAEEGDTIDFRTNQPATIQVFSPSGKELYSADGSSSVRYGGVHTWESGMHYVALHDVTGTQPNITLFYTHMDRYDIVEWDVHKVGDGGCSTITFRGNGFHELTSVELVLGDNKILSDSISLESDAECSVRFNFEMATLGEYDAVFHFVEDDLQKERVVTVESASYDFTLTGGASFNTTFFDTNRYVFSIQNNSNMTAYDVPIAIHIYSPNDHCLRRVDVSGFDMGKQCKELLGENYTDSLAKILRERENTSGDMTYFVLDYYEDAFTEFPYWRHRIINKTLRPNTKETISVRVVSNQDVYVYMYIPEKWDNTIESSGEAKKVKKRGGGVMNGICTIVNKPTKECEDNQKLEEWGMAPIYNRDCKEILKPKKDCKPRDGGKSRHGNSHDPNDIYGYLSESGSKFLADSIERVNYTIEFENDTAFATAAAHTIIVRDTLDASKFDLATFAPTQVKIGNKTEYLDGTTEFVKTIDMRPEIYAIAQVSGTYNHQEGIAEWRFESLDPMTMEPTDNVLQGILPVNYDGTSGIGEVIFEIDVKPSKADGSTVNNRAAIVFDSNEPILTPTWTNIVDAVRPMSTIPGAIQTTDSTLTLRLHGEDERSGIWKYDVYAQMGEGASWERVAENVTDTLVDVRIFEGIEYGFLVLATDSAGNVEQKDFEADFSLSTVRQGDANGDSTVDALDVVLATSYYLGNDVFLNFAATDVNNDGEINSLDVVGIQNIYLNNANVKAMLMPRRRLHTLIDKIKQK